MEAIEVTKVWLTDIAIWIRTKDGNEFCEKFEDYPRLRLASVAERKDYEVTDEGIRWERIDEDLSFEGFLSEKKTNILYDIFMKNPELNASAIARSLGIPQSLFARYISGSKNPSLERMEKIKEALHEVGNRLVAI